MDQKREELREAHRAHLRSAGEKLLGSGALLDGDNGSKIIGGLSILDTEGRIESQIFSDEDPFSVAQIPKAISIAKWRRQ
jgi:uncharacterized protein YciI